MLTKAKQKKEMDMIQKTGEKLGRVSYNDENKKNKYARDTIRHV